MKYIKTYEGILRRFSGLNETEYLSIQKTKDFAKKVYNAIKLLNLGKTSISKFPTPSKSIVKFMISINDYDLIEICWAIDVGLRITLFNQPQPISEVKNFLFDIFSRYSNHSGTYQPSQSKDFSVPWYSIDLILNEIIKEKYELFTYTSKYNL